MRKITQAIIPLPVPYYEGQYDMSAVRHKSEIEITKVVQTVTY